MSAKYKNFFETLTEAQARLLNTIVMDYEDNAPCVVFAITNHKKDGIFRLYSFPLGNKINLPQTQQFMSEDTGLGEYLDDYMSKNKDCPLSRKYMNSPRFKNFRPFPLGMCNVVIKETSPVCVYLERQPQRHREQGLTKSMVTETQISTGENSTTTNPYGVRYVDVFSETFRDCILGRYPSAHETLEKLKDPEVLNNAVGFHREFALVRGPVDTLFLAYKADVVGLLPNRDFTDLLLAKKFKQLRERIQALNLFQRVI